MRNALFSLIGLVFVLTACTSHKRVEDPSSGRAYYTTKIDKNKSGSIEFTDARTGGKVTMQDSVVVDISEEEFDAAVEGEPEADDDE